MTENVTLVEAATGRILGNLFNVSEDYPVLAGQIKIQGVEGNSVDHYWNGSSIVPRPTLPNLPSTIVVNIILSEMNFPNGASVRVVNEGRQMGQGVISGNQLSIKFGYIGTFEIYVGENETAFPSKERVYAITVVSS